MRTLNQIKLLGRVASAPFYTTTEKSAADLTQFSISTQQKPSSLEGAVEELHNCIAWGPTALLLHEHLKQGSQLAIEGHLSYHHFKISGGATYARPEIVVKRFTFLDG